MLTMRRWLLTLASVLTLVTIGGQCRGSLAQSMVRVPETLTKDDEPQPRVRVPRKSPMTAAEWGRSYDECIKVLGLPVILATRTPGISAGVGCVTGQD